MNMKIAILFLIFWACNLNAFEIVGRTPPSTHTLEQGTYNAFESISGARRYYLIEESSVCNNPPIQVQIPTGGFTIRQEQLFKRYRSRTGVISYYPVTFVNKCRDLRPPPTPAQPDINYTGLRRLYINPNPNDANDCTCLRLNVLEKLDGSKYQVDMDVWDCATIVNNQRVCNVK